MVVGWERFAKDSTPCPVVITLDKIAAVKLGKELEREDPQELCRVRTRDPCAHRSVRESYGIQSGDEAEDVGGVFGGQRDGG